MDVLFFICYVTANSRLVSASFVDVDSLKAPSNDFFIAIRWSDVGMLFRVALVKVEFVRLLNLSNIGVCGDCKCVYKFC